MKSKIVAMLIVIGIFGMNFATISMGITPIDNKIIAEPNQKSILSLNQILFYDDGTNETWEKNEEKDGGNITLNTTFDGRTCHRLSGNQSTSVAYAIQNETFTTEYDKIEIFWIQNTTMNNTDDKADIGFYSRNCFVGTGVQEHNSTHDAMWVQNGTGVPIIYEYIEKNRNQWVNYSLRAEWNGTGYTYDVYDNGTYVMSGASYNLSVFGGWISNITILQYSIGTGSSDSHIWFDEISFQSITHIHSPIRINSNTDFTFDNGVTSGTGVWNDPYIIDNWIINGTGYGSGIYIGNTTKHFIIRNCTIYNSTNYSSSVYYGESGICIYETYNATIHNNTFWNNTRQIYMENSVQDEYNITITKNKFSNLDESLINYGIYIENANNITIDNNNATDLYGFGMDLDTINNATIINNEMNNVGKGSPVMRFFVMENFTVSNNTILIGSMVNANGMLLTDIKNGQIDSNYIFDMLIAGMIIASGGGGVDNVTVFHNEIEDCQYGLRITTPSVNNVTIYHNNFIDNSVSHIESIYSSTSNKFHLGHQFGGNYYNDLITEDFYHGINQNLVGIDNLNDTGITVSANVNDAYPLIYPFETNNTPVAEAGADNYTQRVHYISAYNSSDAGGSALNYTWNFTYNSNPYTYYTMNFSFNFAIQGNYTVTLNVTDIDGNWDIDTMTVYAQPLTANAGADDSVYRGNSYQFNASGSLGAINNWTWNFTHNSTSEYLYGETPSFEFWELGIINVTLNVTDVYGSYDLDWMNLTVLNNPPTANAGVNQAGLKGIYTLDGSGSSDIDGTIQNYTWNFTYNGNPQTLYLTYPMFNFQILGNYFITLNVTDNDGGYDHDTTWVNISNANPVANAGTDIIGKRLITFDGSLSSDVDGSIVNYTWTFSDDGTPVTLYGVSPSYDFNISQAPITVTLNVTDDEGGTDEDTVLVTLVFQLPIADAGEDQGTNKGTFILDGSGSSDPDGSIINWTWTFTYDGSPETLWGDQPTFDFLLEGNYQITLNVTDDDWRYDEDTTWVNITFKKPVASFTINPSGTLKGWRLVDGNPSSDADGTIVNYTYEWEYNSITYYRYVAQFSFNFLLEGTYNITLNITDDDGLQDETYRTFSIVFVDPVAVISDIPSFIITDNVTKVLQGNEIEFDGSESYDLDGTIANYTWSFTYNNVSYEYYGVSFNFTFSESEENITITLNVTDDDGLSDETSIIITVRSASEYLADLLLLLIPLFIVLMLVMIVIAYVKKTTNQQEGDI